MAGRGLLMVGLGAALLLAAAAGADAATKVPLRAADHGDFARVVFDWPTADVKYTAAIAEGRLLVTFTEAVEAVPKPIADRLAAWFTTAGLEQGGRVVAFTLKRPAKLLKEGRSGNAFYLDLAEDKSAPPLVQKPPAATPAPPPTSAPAPTAAPTPAQPQPQPQAQAQAQAKTPPPPAAPPPAAPGPAPPPPGKPSAAPAAVAPPPAAVPPAAAAPVPPPPPARGEPPPAQVIPPAPAPAPGKPLPPGVVAASPVLVFDPGQPAAAAVYVRSDQMYLVFDRPLSIGAGTMTGNPGGLIGPVQPVLASGGSAFRVSVRPWLRPVIEREGTLWRVVFVPKTQPSRLELAVEAQPDFPLGGRVLVHAPDAPAVVELTDPEVGDRLLVVPLPAAVQAVSMVNRFPEADFLSALQGVVIRPHGDGVAVRLVREGLEVTAAGGLRLSPATDSALIKPTGPGATDAILNALGGVTEGRQAEADRSSPQSADHRLFDLPGWQRGGRQNFTANRQELMQQIANVLPKERNRVRLELARFYFGHSFNQEAIGVLNVLAADQPDVQGWPEFRALRGAARVAAGQARDGLEDLSGTSLDDNREAMLWRAAALTALRENAPKAAHDFYLADDILVSYPEPYFRRLSLAAVDARIQTGDFRDADRLLKRLIRRAGSGSDEQPPMEFYRGEIYRLSGKVDEALKHLHAAEDGGDRYFRARAGLSRVNLEVQEKRISPATASDRLSRLRFAWRGDELELDIVQRHGEMQWEAGDYADGLNTLREAASYFPDSPRSAAITRSMTQLFGALYQDGAAKLPPLKAIELYDQFRELTPIGVAGDEVIRQLAERLVEVDLLGRAGELLQHQVDYRLTGLDKCKVATRLASIRLLDAKPDQALKAIEVSEFEAAPPKLVEDRRLLKARALADLKRSHEALRLLEGDDSGPADMLRVDIAWHDQRWDDAAVALEKVIGEPPAAGTKLDKTKATLVLNRAIALALAGDGSRLDALRTGFGAAMAKTEEAHAFAVLTRPDQGAGQIDFASIKARVNEVDVFQNFLKDFKKTSLAK
ncbi:MAG: tetratricopeptide repeat protein [Rhodospirillaceae bacterium]